MDSLTFSCVNLLGLEWSFLLSFSFSGKMCWGDAIGLLGLRGLGEAGDCVALRSQGPPGHQATHPICRFRMFHITRRQMWSMFLSWNRSSVLNSRHASNSAFVHGVQLTTPQESPKAVWAFTSLDAFRRPLRLYPEGLSHMARGFLASAIVQLVPSVSSGMSFWRSCQAWTGTVIDHAGFSHALDPCPLLGTCTPMVCLNRTVRCVTWIYFVDLCW